MIKTQSLLGWQNRVILFLLCLWCVWTAVLYAQWTTDTRRELIESKSDIKNIVQSPVSNVPPLEGPIDPDKYYIGPSDVLSVNIWTSPAINFALTVTPEGTLIIPTVGEVRVADLTLAEAKKKVIAEIKKKYLTGDPSVTLLTPRQVSVTITGVVRYPGKYVLNAVDRIDRVIAEADRARKEDRGDFSEQGQSRRNIILTRRDGKTQRIDVPKYYATKDDQWNPFLREGDEVFVPRIDPKKNVFAIYGGVNVQGSFELVEGDSLFDAFELAYGFTSRARKDSISLYRYDIERNIQNTIVFDYDQIKQGAVENLALIPGDRIIIQEQPDIREDYRVSVEGEVRYPGIYPITKDSTKLTKVIGWAGGFTEYSSLSAAELVRSAVPPGEQQLERILSLRGSVSPEDSAYYVLESELRMTRELVNVDFTKLFVGRDTTEDVFLQNGDRIFIPSIRKTIYVFGQVISPGNVPYIEGEDYKYYIEKVGGYTDKARTGDVMIIKRATRQWLSPGETEIEEGDYIWVPKEPERTFAYYMSIFSQTAAVITAAVSIALLAIQLRK